MATNKAAYAATPTPTLSIESSSPPITPKGSFPERALTKMLGFADFSKRNYHKDVEVDEELPFDSSICHSSYRGVFVVRLAIMVSDFRLQATTELNFGCFSFAFQFLLI